VDAGSTLATDNAKEGTVRGGPEKEGKDEDENNTAARAKSMQHALMLVGPSKAGCTFATRARWRLVQRQLWTSASISAEEGSNRFSSISMRRDSTSLRHAGYADASFEFRQSFAV
jgi:hypothetical protein